MNQGPALTPGREVFSGSLLLAGAYAILAPGGRGVALPWPADVRVTVGPAPAWRLAVSDDLGTREVSIDGFATLPVEGPPLAIGLDFGALPAGGTSALACLAVARARIADPAGVRARALTLHRALQGGRGSGYDVLVSSERRPLALQAGRDRRVVGRAFDLGAATSLRVGVAPKRGRTADRIARFEAATLARPRDVEGLVRATSEAAGDLIVDLEEGRSDALSVALARLASLRALANELLGAPYGAPLDEALVAASVRLGVPAHPSGAAGDCWLAAHPDDERLGALAIAWRGLGLRVFDARWEPPLVLGLSPGDPGR